MQKVLAISENIQHNQKSKGFQFASGCDLKCSFEAENVDQNNENLPVSLIGPTRWEIIALRLKQKQKPTKKMLFVIVVP